MRGLTLPAVWFLLVAIALGPGIVFAWLARRARRSGRPRTAVSARVASIILFVLMPLWVVASVHAWWEHSFKALKLPYVEMHSVYMRAWGIVKDDPTASWPPARPAGAPEAEVFGEPVTYLPVANFHETRTARPDAWLAYSARMTRRFWYAPWFDIDVRAVLHADGSVRMLDEDYFQSLRDQRGGSASAPSTTTTESKERRDPHVVGPD